MRSAGGRSCTATKGRVLVVDDDPPIAVLWTRTLERSFYDVRAALDPEAALAIAPAFRPHVAVLDIGLPRMDGRELGRRLREFDPDLAIVLVTGDERLLARHAHDAGVATEMVKPLGLDDLTRMVDVLLLLRGRDSRIRTSEG